MSSAGCLSRRERASTSARLSSLFRSFIPVFDGSAHPDACFNGRWQRCASSSGSSASSRQCTRTPARMHIKKCGQCQRFFPMSDLFVQARVVRRARTCAHGHTITSACATAVACPHLCTCAHAQERAHGVCVQAAAASRNGAVNGRTLLRLDEQDMHGELGFTRLQVCNTHAPRTNTHKYTDTTNPHQHVHAGVCSASTWPQSWPGCRLVNRPPCRFPLCLARLTKGVSQRPAPNHCHCHHR